MKIRVVDWSIILIGLAVLFLIFEKFQGVLRPFTMSLMLMFLFLPALRVERKRKWVFFGSEPPGKVIKIVLPIQ